MSYVLDLADQTEQQNWWNTDWWYNFYSSVYAARPYMMQNLEYSDTTLNLSLQNYGAHVNRNRLEFTDQATYLAFVLEWS